MSFHILGVGAIGCLLAHQLKQLPNPPEVTLLLRSHQYAKDILFSSKNDQGLTISATRYGSTSISRGYKLEVARMEEQWYTKKGDPARFLRRRSVVWKILPPTDPTRKSKILKSRKMHPIETLILTTKSNHSLVALEPLYERLSAKSTIIILQNGMGQEDEISRTFWPTGSEGGGRPTFVVGTTMMAALRGRDRRRFEIEAIGEGESNYTVLPNSLMIQALADWEQEKLKNFNKSSPSSSSESEEYKSPILNPQSVFPFDISTHLPPYESDPRLQSLHNALSALSQLPRSHIITLPNFRRLQLQKLAVNCAINSLTSIHDVPNGKLLDDDLREESLKVFEQVASEASAAYFAESRRLDPSQFAGAQNSYPPTHALGKETLFEKIKAAAISTAKNVSSTLQDIRGGSATEVEYLMGYLVRLGESNGVEMPTMRDLYEKVLVAENNGIEAYQALRFMLKGTHKKKNEERIMGIVMTEDERFAEEQMLERMEQQDAMRNDEAMKLLEDMEEDMEEEHSREEECA